MEKYLTKIPQLVFSADSENSFLVDFDLTSSLFTMVTKRAFEEKENPKLFGVFMATSDKKKIKDIIVSWYFNEYLFSYELISGIKNEKDEGVIQQQLIRFLYESSIENTVYHFNNDRGFEIDHVSKFMLETKNDSGIIEMIIGEGENERVYKVSYIFQKDNIESSRPKIEEIIKETDIKVMPKFHEVSNEKRIIH